MKKEKRRYVPAPAKHTRSNPATKRKDRDMANTLETTFPYVSPDEAAKVAQLFEHLNLCSVPDQYQYQGAEELTRQFPKVGVLNYDGIRFSVGSSSTSISREKKDS